MELQEGWLKAKMNRSANRDAVVVRRVLELAEDEQLDSWGIVVDRCLVGTTVDIEI